MIIGKSLTALGGGGLKPEIRVTAKAGALLNLYFKDSSIILKTYQLGADETTHTFVVSMSETAYVVEDATNGKSVEVLADAVAQYDIVISYRPSGALYWNGDPCEDVTGGWHSANVGSKTGIIENDKWITFRMSDYLSGETTQHTGTILLNKTVDPSGYSVLKLSGNSFNGQTSSYPKCSLLITDGISSTLSRQEFVKVGTASTFEITINVDSLSNTSIMVIVEAYYASFNVDKVWFE